MIKHWRNAFVVLALAPTAAWAQSPFTGKWKLDLGAVQLPSKPVVFLLKDGVFSCKSCVPAVALKADGAAHPVTGFPYFDHAMVKVIDAYSIEGVRMKGGRTTSKLHDTVSADGKTLTSKYEDLTVAASPVTGVEILTRVEAAPAGSHLLSGSWKEQKLSDLSSNSLVTEMSVVGDMVHVSTPAGQSYLAKLGGPAAPYKGDPGITGVTVQMQGPRTLVETDLRDGKPISVDTMTVSPDGKSMKVDVDDKLHGTTSHFKAMKV